ncbi:hypothetical protein A9Q84_02830 [Halobacteriovorax marinus]|uniref:Response regulatory domain-containing protein n=1 Tax=Halobacteriovorax marinus TaxID=97084 RepID=A0A1Y5FIG9_9BACT|nr:hypothetical protein A9Q84_02830 [Halobacteriovorax marinus]
MKHFLLIDDNFDHIELLMTSIESRFDNEILIAGTISEALFVLENRKDIGVIIADYNMREGTGGDVYKRYRELGYNIPFVLLTAESIEDLSEFDGFIDSNTSLHRYLQKPYKMNDLVEMLEDLMGDGANQDDSKYKKVRIQSYLTIHKTNFPLFVKINEDKIIQLSQLGDEDSDFQLKKLQDKGLLHIYLTNEDYKSFINESYSSMTDLLISEKTTVSDKIDAQFDSVDSFHDGLVLLGMPEASLSLAQKSIDTTITNLRKTKGLTPVLTKILSRKGYVQQISLLTNYISVAIAKETEYADTKLYEKLSLAAIFMDMSLQEEEPCKVLDIKEQKYKDFDFGTRGKISAHSEKSCEILESYLEISQDVRNIILEHHERPDGSGFPRGITTSSIKFPSAIFILAHEFSHHLILSSINRVPLKEVLLRLYLDYDTGNFKKPLEAFKRVFKFDK